MEHNNNNLLSHICRIDNHPVKDLPISIKQRYLTGLGVVLYTISNGNATMKTLFTQWAYSITGQESSHFFSQQTDDCVKKALSINRIGFRFFRCKHEFFFDCFYLTESFDKGLLPKLSEYLTLIGKNIFTKESLKTTIDYFNSSCDKNVLKVPECLQKHRLLNISFKQQKQKRVLVVANVSAGKSTLINALLGYRFNNVRTTACTSRLCEIYNKPVEDGFTYLQSNHLQFDPNIDAYSSDNACQVGMHFKSTLGDTNICLIDTPGVNNSTDTDHWKITTTAINRGAYDIVVFISNGKYNGTIDERKILEHIYKNCKKPVLFVLNQLDTFKRSVDNIDKMIQGYMNEIKAIGFKNPQVYPVSAIYAFMLRHSSNLDEDELDELELIKKRFSKDYYNLPKYVGFESTSDIERTGFIHLEKGIIKQ